MPSRLHDVVARVLPKVRRSRELDTEANERARVERWHTGLDRSLPTALVPRFEKRFAHVVEDLDGFPVHVITPRHLDPQRTVLHLHGGGFMAPIDPFHVRYAARLARSLRARVVIPDYPLAPEHTWRDSFDAVVGLTGRWAGEGRLTLLGDSAGGGYALSVAQALRDRGGAQPAELVLLSPWVDLSMSSPDHPALDAVDGWLFLGKARAYGRWWAGSEEDLVRPEVSPLFGELDGLPRTLMFCGTRDLLVPGVRRLAERAADADWELVYVEEPDLLHVFPLLPLIPEARLAWRTTLEYLR